MDTLLIIVGAMILLQFLIENIFKYSNHQMNISLYGIHKIPKIILELAKINKNNIGYYTELSKEEQEKYTKIYDKMNNAIYCTLTYIRSHNLIHIQKDGRSYFYKISDNDRYLIYEEIGKLPDGKEVNYVLYRKDNGWLRGSVLIGYLLKRTPLGKEEVMLPLFKFPERLITKRFFNKGLLRKYKLKEDTVADYLNKDELGYSRGIYGVSIETENKEGINFWFRIY